LESKENNIVLYS